MLWAACCLALFGFLRISEFTVPCHTDYDPSLHLSLQDISIDNRGNPCILKVNIKQSKTDPFQQGVQIYLGATDTPLCPILGMLPYQEEEHAPALSSSLSMAKDLPGNILCTAINSILTEL